jgi:hypothetical protein
MRAIEAFPNNRRLMKNSRWSPSDLERQRHIVRRIQLRSELDLRSLAAARARLAVAFHKQIGVPLALAGCFVAGMIAVPRARPQRKGATAQGPTDGLRHITKLFRVIALTATAYSALFPGNRGAPSRASRR